MEEYDVLIVGAGPGGSSAAKKCVDGGLKTLLIERMKLPRRKACSGLITNVSQNYILENFGPMPEKVWGAPYINKGVALHFPKHGTIYTDVDCYSLYVWRDKFDYFLATKSKAKIQDNTCFANFTEKDGKYEVTLKSKGKKRKIRTKYLVGADGAYSRVTKRLAPEVFNNQYRVWTCQKYFEGTIDADDRYFYWMVERGLGPMPYLTIKDGQILAGLVQPLGTKFNKIHQEYLEYLKRDFNLKIKREIATEGCYVNLGTPMSHFFAGRNNVIMVGDAVGFVNQGHCSISSALVSGGYAGESIIEAMNKGTDALAKYKEMIKPEIQNSLDQYNPFHLRSTAGSDASRQPPLFHGIGFLKRISVIKELMGFIKSEYVMFKGFLPMVLKNIVRRAILREYKISIVE